MSTARWRFELRGQVQGVGARPFVWREATALGLTGRVWNGPGALLIEAQGPSEALEALRLRLGEAPPPVMVRRTEVEALPVLAGEVGFVMGSSALVGASGPVLPADRVTCEDCLNEVNDPVSRRYRYVFTTCTRCGPRYTIADALPFDRERTAMAGFPLCEACRAEYEDPRDRRCHAQAMACPACGPRLAVADNNLTSNNCNTALQSCYYTLTSGMIAAVKGLGGFQLLVDATSEEAVRRLRDRKGRPERPLAVLFQDLAQLQAHATPTEDETSALQASDGPIVLVPLRHDHGLAPSVTCGLRRVGALLPTTPLHHLLVREAGRPLVCTSGNRTGQPLALDLEAARRQLTGVADLYLDHDRPIRRQADDSVLRVVRGAPILLRGGRGRAPHDTALGGDGPAVLALGAHLKATVTLAWGGLAVTSPHIGDLGDAEARRRLLETADDLCRFYGVRPELIAADLHPDYGSTRVAEALAERWGAPLERVQHHHAHAAAVLVEHGRSGGLALCWDGLGLGTDGRSWGGELLQVEAGGFVHRAGLRPFPSVGDGRARGPVRTAMSLYQMLQAGDSCPVEVAGWLDPHLSPAERASLETPPPPALRAHESTAMGRLFEGFAFWAGGRATTTYEAQAALALEQDAERGLLQDDEAWEMPVLQDLQGPARVDWGPALRALWRDRAAGAPREVLAARFHRSLAALAVRLVEGAPAVALAGGCLQNAVLVDLVGEALRAAGVEPLFARDLPANDGAISLGQAVVARQRAQAGSSRVPSPNSWLR